MNAYLDTLKVVAQIALRNLFASRIKTFIVGGIITFGAFIIVIGTSLLDSVDQSMSRSITGSIAGDIQVYSAESKETLDVFGGFGPGGNDIAPLADFARIRQTLINVPNVTAVVPMGIDTATVTAGNSIDQVLSQFRDAATKINNGDKSATTAADYAAQKGHIRQIVKVLRNDYENVKKVRADGTDVGEELSYVQKASSDDFWNKFDQDSFGNLEFLENRIAPLVSDADMLFLRYIGTDPAEFRRSFDRMTVVEGQPIPEGKRGFLFSKYVYEEQVKLRTARTLDKVKVARDNRKERIAKEPELLRMIQENANNGQEILLQLDGEKTALFRRRLGAYLHSEQSDVGQLLAKFLLMNDDNFDERYQFYYQQLAPSLQLYKVRVGDTLTIKAYTRSGYVQSANLHVYGIFAFKGLEKSPQAGAMNMMDLVSFRELYGYLTADREKEIRELRSKSGAQDVARESADALLFGSAAKDDSKSGEATTPTVGPTLTEELSLIAGSRQRAQAQEAPYDPTQLEQGVVLNAAVFLKNAREMDKTLAAIESAAVRDHLPLKALSWQKAVGVTGQFTVLMRAVLYTAVIIIFLVALIIINNALVMATLERVREFGTLRAIGAQRRFIWIMLVFESIVTGLLFGLIGILLGSLFVSFLGRQGVPAWNDIVTFFFSGPRLYPILSGRNVLLALVIVLIVSIVSSTYPAWLAMRVSPRQAMQSEE